jgi:hypothetical protein
MRRASHPLCVKVAANRLNNKKQPLMVGRAELSVVRLTFEIGTEEWIAQTGGRLTIAQAIGLSTQGLTQAVSERLNPRRAAPNEGTHQLERVKVARQELLGVLATQRARVEARQGEALLNHACRTFLLGAALLSDDEFGKLNLMSAAVAALAHDDGLVNPSSSGNCFTADSATEASTMMAQLEAPDDAMTASRAAVVSHFQPKLPKRAGADARLVALGASADVMGFGLKRVDPGLQEMLWQEWPELGFLTDVKRLLKGERTRAPWTRPGVLSWSGMPYMLRSKR